MKLVIHKKYSLICADPPWPYPNWVKTIPGGDNSRKVMRINPKYVYPTMSIQNIANLDVPSICAKDAILAMWTTDGFLEQALMVMAAWGFTYKTIAFYWSKKTVNGLTASTMGEYTLKCGELCLLGTCGKPKHLIKNRKQRQLLEAVRTYHSHKPVEALNRLRRMVPNGFALEMFSRNPRKYWDIFGNKVKNSINIPMRKNVKMYWQGISIEQKKNLPWQLKVIPKEET